MKIFFFLCFLFYSLTSCSQSKNIAGEYETKNGAVHYFLKLNPNGTFHFDSYNKFNSGLPADPSISGRGRWNYKNDHIYFETDRERDMDHNYRLNFTETRARFKGEASKNETGEAAVVKLEFFESGIFWLEGIELQRRK